MGSEAGSVHIIIVLLFFALIKNVMSQNSTLEDSEAKLLKGYARQSNFTELTRSYGYTSEEHTVVTADGYILSVFRIPRGKNCKGPMRRPPVLLMHGVLMSADSWVVAGPSAGLAFLISDACYDLWLGNVRGNYYGRRNVRLDPDVDSEFWNFYSDEMGRLDAPATIDYILNNTGSKELIYVGYSQGSRMLFIMCSETVGYCNKIKIAINIAPATRLTGIRSTPVRLLVEFYAAVEPVLSGARAMEVLREGGAVQGVASFLCKDYIFASTICKTALYAIDSYDPLSYLTDTVRVLYDYFPAGSSALNAAHYGQNVITRKFQRYDYGPVENLQRYGSVRPTLYNLSRTDMPVVLVYGLNDFLINPVDVAWLSHQLPNVLETYQVRRAAWNHLDNCYSQFTKQTIFPKINDYMQRYSQVDKT